MSIVFNNLVSSCNGMLLVDVLLMTLIDNNVNTLSTSLYESHSMPYFAINRIEPNFKLCPLTTLVYSHKYVTTAPRCKQYWFAIPLTSHGIQASMLNTNCAPCLSKWKPAILFSLLIQNWQDCGSDSYMDISPPPSEDCTRDQELSSDNQTADIELRSASSSESDQSQEPMVCDNPREVMLERCQLFEVNCCSDSVIEKSVKFWPTSTFDKLQF